MTGTTAPTDTRSWYVWAFQQIGCPVAVALLLIAWDAGWLPSASREALPIVRLIKHDTAEAVGTQRQFKHDLLMEIRAIRRRQAALCLIMLSQFASKAQDVESIREACVSEAMGGNP